jgi:uncharacterized membrane protein
LRLTMRKMRKWLLPMFLFGLFAFVVAPAIAEARPRSGGSFSGRGGFRSAPRGFSSNPGNNYRGSRGGGSNFIFLPGFGWGWGGYGGGGGSILGTLLLLGVVGLGAVMVVRAVRRAQGRYGSQGGMGQGLMGGGGRSVWGGYDDDDDGDVVPDRAFVYKVQLGLGRSARDIQQRLARFAAEGDTNTEAGLSHLLQQTSLELMRHRDSIRYGAVESSGPMSLTNGETKMNSAALNERSRFQIERVRGADGVVRKSDVVAGESLEALEYLVVTVVMAARAPVIDLKKLEDRDQLTALLGQLGAVPSSALLGLEVIWTPADPEDSLTESDLLTTYPELRSL